MSSIKPRKKLTPELKFQIVIESLQDKRNQTEIARQHGIHPQLLVNWRRQFLNVGPKIFLPKREEKKRAEKVEELEKIIGQQTIEIQFLKKVLGHLD